MRIDARHTHQLITGTVSPHDFDLSRPDSEMRRKNGNSRGVSLPVHWRGRDPNPERVAMPSDDLGPGGVGTHPEFQNGVARIGHQTSEDGLV